MPSDYRNSLGFLNLQLRASQLAQDQQRQFQLEQQNREAAQQDVQNTLSFMQHHEQSKSASEDRKLALANLLQRTQMAEAGKNQRQDDKQAFDAPKVQAMIDKAIAEKGLAEARAKEVPLESRRRDTDVASKVTDRVAQHKDRVSGQKMSLLGKDLAYDPVYGGRDEAAAQKAHDILGLGALTPPDPGLVRTPKSEVGKVFNDVRQGQNSEIDVDAALQGLESADPSDFGVQGSRLGFNMPIVGRVNPNTIQDLLGSAKKALGDENNSDSKATQRRTLIEQSYGRQVANTIRYLSGLASSDQEAARIFAQFGVKPDDSGKIDIFGADLDTLKAAMKAAKEYISRKKANDVSVAQEGGVRVNPAEPPKRREPPAKIMTAEEAMNTPVQEDPKRAALKKRVMEIMAKNPNPDRKAAQRAATAQALAETQ